MNSATVHPSTIAFDDARLERLLPPAAYRRAPGGGGADFLTVGKHVASLLVDHAGLTPTSRVLDIGCSVGRVAIPLSQIIVPPGRYDGFDVVLDSVKVASRQLAAFPHFGFQWVNVQNAAYHARGSIAASGFRFPYPDASFDVVFATSVFTHMAPRDVHHYIKEVARVLAPDGHALTTFFALTPVAIEAMEMGRTDRRFNIDAPASDLAAAAQYASYIDEWFAEAGLSVVAFHPGAWSGAERPLSYQDVFIVEKGR